jgi:hypothetical protein
MDKLQKLVDEGFICFTFSGISIKTNAKGEEKKFPMGMPKHGDINADNFTDYCNASHKGAAIITGKMSNITVIDFDDKTAYDDIVNKYPDFKNFRTIKTNKGYHVYCKYNSNLTSNTNVLKSFSGVDIRNDGGIVFCPPCSYKLPNGTVVKYEDMGGNILPIPEIIMSDIKPEKFVNYAPVKAEQVKAEPVVKETQYKTSEKDNLEYIANAIEKGFLDFKSLSNSYDDWRDVGFIFKHTSESKECLELFHKFSAINTAKYDKSYTDAFWKTIKQTAKPLTIGSLKKWVTDQTKKIKEGSMIANTDLEAANLLFEELKTKLISSSGRLFYHTNNIWIDNDIDIQNHIIYYIMNRNIFTIDDKGNLSPYGQSISRAEKIAKSLYVKIRVDNNDPHLYTKFHTTTKSKLCFNDGVLDFKAKTFTLWSKIPVNTIYSTIKINRDFGAYFNNPNRKDIKDITEKIFETSYGKNKNRALHFLSRAIAGHAEDKRWATYQGSRNSGKGVEYDLLKYSLENYVKTFELGNILYSRKTAGVENVDCSKKLYWLMDLEFTRLAVSQEIPDPKAQLIANGKMLKKISGGEDTIVARRNYDREDTHFTLDATFYIKGNYDLLIDNNDCNETRVEFNSIVSFVDQSQIDTYKQYGMEEDELKRYKVADSEIRKTIKSTEWANAIIYMLYENYNNNRINIIAEITMEEISPYKAIKDKYILTGNHDDIILCQDLHDNLSDFCKGKLSIELQALNVLKKKCAKAGPMRNKWVYSGIKLKPIEKDLEETKME